MGLNFVELRDFLDEKVNQYDTTDFIGPDPIQILLSIHVIPKLMNV